MVTKSPSRAKWISVVIGIFAALTLALAFTSFGWYGPVLDSEINGTSSTGSETERGRPFQGRHITSSDPPACDAKEGMLVDDVGFELGEFFSVEVTSRIRNTCDENIAVSITAVVYDEDGAVLRMRKAFQDLHLSLGESRDIAITVIGSNARETRTAEIETRFAL